jgi:hypothetical protein
VSRAEPTISLVAPVHFLLSVPLLSTRRDAPAQGIAERAVWRSVEGMTSWCSKLGSSRRLGAVRAAAPILRRRRLLGLRGGIGLLACATGVAGAQQGTTRPSDSVGTIVGDVVASGDARPLAYATVIVEPGNRERFADAGGAFYVGDLAPGAYRLRVRQIGFAPTDTVITVSAGTTVQRLRIILRVVALKLPQVTIRGERPLQCVAPGVPDSAINPSLAELFGELQKNVDRYRLLIDEYPFEFTREEWRVARNDAGYEQTVSLDTVRYDVRKMEGRPYKPGKVVAWEIGPRGNAQQYMYLPTFRYLGDSTFQRTHCFEYVGEDTTGGFPTIRVDFRPAATIHTPDVEGSVYLDETRYVVRRAVFRLTEPGRIVPPISELSVTTTFREIVPLVPLFDEVRYVKPTYSNGNAATMEVDRLLLFKFERGAPGGRKG